MLILTRNIGESLVIAGDVVVTALSISGHKVRLGVQAPHDVTVYREEVFGRMQSPALQRGEQLQVQVPQVRKGRHLPRGSGRE